MSIATQVNYYHVGLSEKILSSISSWENVYVLDSILMDTTRMVVAKQLKHLYSHYGHGCQARTVL